MRKIARPCVPEDARSADCAALGPKHGPWPVKHGPWPVSKLAAPAGATLLPLAGRRCATQAVRGETNEVPPAYLIRRVLMHIKGARALRAGAAPPRVERARRGGTTVDKYKTALAAQVCIVLKETLAAISAQVPRQGIVYLGVGAGR